MLSEHRSQSAKKRAPIVNYLGFALQNEILNLLVLTFAVANSIFKWTGGTLSVAGKRGHCRRAR